MSETASPSARLRALLEEPTPLLLPGVGSALEARAAQASGFPAIYISGYATAAAVHGVPDVGLIALAEVVANAATITRRTSLPVVVDADTGYGDVSNVADTVRRLEAVGVAGVQLEDQTWPKRCGHLAGKAVEPAEVMLRKIAAACAARRDGTVIVARTDARAPLGIEEAIERARRYRQAGADVTFVDAPESRAELEAIAAEVDGPKLVNMSESGRTPLLGVDELAEIGFDVVLFPTSALRIAARAYMRFFDELRAAGDSSAWLDRMASLDELNALVGLDELQAFEREVLATSATP